MGTNTDDIQAFCTDDNEVIRSGYEPITKVEENVLEKSEKSETDEELVNAEKNVTFENNEKTEYQPKPKEFKKHISSRKDENKRWYRKENETDDVTITQEEVEAPAETANNLTDMINNLSEHVKNIEETLFLLTQSIDRLTAQTASVGRAVTVHETIEKNLNDELQKYKSDYYSQMATPFMLHLISLYLELSEEYNDIINSFEQENEVTEETKKIQMEYINSIKYYLDKVSGAMNNCGIDIVTPAVGDKFNHIEHMIVKTVLTDDPKKVELIESVKTSTFIYKGKVIRPARVIVYKK